ncbi:unnamed protein product [Sympodiomycopsis kandeliae]
MTSDPIPLVDSLSSIYSSQSAVLSQGPRWDNLLSSFSQHFNGEKPSFVARAPGRVNVIGEHVDHMKFGVFPAALELDILMAVRVVPSSSGSESGVEFQLRNTTPRFEAIDFKSGLKNTNDVELLHSGPTRWANYFKVAWKGLHPHLPEQVLTDKNLTIQVVVDGTIPPESSLSSSAAMTVCSSITILQSLGARELVSRSEMTEVAIESERLVGVASGGMDQSASVFGSPNCALHITFFPRLKVEKVQLPPSTPECTFVIANTLVVSDKKVNGPVQYNLRVVELLLAARVFARKHGLPLDDSTKTWRPLMEVYYAKYPLRQEDFTKDTQLASVHETLGLEAAQIYHMSRIIPSSIPSGNLSRSEVESLTGYSGTSFAAEFLSQFEIRADNFNLLSRVEHVFAESLRVHEFRGLCTRSAASDPDLYTQLGALMNASHDSLASKYENSCPELDSIISIARKNGSLGSRLTGAGWGGSTVHLVRKDDVPKVLEALEQEYYQKRWEGITEEEVQKALLVSQPAGGACVYSVQ